MDSRRFSLQKNVSLTYQWACVVAVVVAAVVVVVVGVVVVACVRVCVGRGRGGGDRAVGDSDRAKCSDFAAPLYGVTGLRPASRSAMRWLCRRS